MKKRKQETAPTACAGATVTYMNPVPAEEIPMLRLTGINYRYSVGTPFEKKALDNINLNIRRGRITGLIGHTGSGKSTLVQLLNGLNKPESGTVELDGTDIWAEPKKIGQVRFRVGLVMQYPEYQLFEETVAKDIAFGPKNQGLSPEEIDQRVRRAMAHVQLDYDRYADRSPFELSGGQMRRVAIAGVLAMEPKVLILDEPTAGLDPRGRDRILGMIRDLHAEGGVTVVMVSHSMDDVARLATRMVVMSRGRLVAEGTPRSIFQQGDMMRSIGLDVPAAVKLCAALRERGIDLPGDLYTPDEVRDALLRRWKERGAQ